MKNLHLTLTPFRNESRLKKQSQALVDSGVMSSVVVLALWELGLREREAFHPGCSVFRMRLKTRDWGTNLFVQLVKYMEFLFRALWLAKKDRVQVVNCHALALLPVGYLIKLICGAVLVYDPHELETERNGLAGVRKKLSKLVERALIAKCDHVFVVGEMIAEHYRAQYDLDNVTCVLNCPEVVAVPEKGNKFNRAFAIAEGTPIFIYQGLLSSGRGIEVILNAFASLDAGECALVVMGYGELEEQVRTYADNHRNIFFQPAVAPEEVLDYTCSADVGLCLIEPKCLSYEYCLPNKLFEYMNSGLKVIATDLPEIRKVVEKEFAVRVPDVSETSLIAAVKDVLQLEQGDVTPEVDGKYTWAHQKEIMIDAYKRHIV